MQQRRTSPKKKHRALEAPRRLSASCIRHALAARDGLRAGAADLANPPERHDLLSLADRLRQARTYNLHGLPTVARTFAIDLDYLNAAAALAYPG